MLCMKYKKKDFFRGFSEKQNTLRSSAVFTSLLSGATRQHWRDWLHLVSITNDLHECSHSFTVISLGWHHGRALQHINWCALKRTSMVCVLCSSHFYLSCPFKTRHLILGVFPAAIDQIRKLRPAGWGRRKKEESSNSFTCLRPNRRLFILSGGFFCIFFYLFIHEGIRPTSSRSATVSCLWTPRPTICDLFLPEMIWMSVGQGPRAPDATATAGCSSFRWETHDTSVWINF